MFYSQFILAKKGPLGTIWIAAHLERKLRKNQVADTDIGVSVDSILFPEVPIALRLSSHLLLGVVRIYSRKVNYLFHDCSEALLNVKQAFRSTAVDLPPEESTAPYHSITLPETFDLDDFELPDSALLTGNFDDRHVSTREQITLQDTLDGSGYSTSQFGLDERFGDGDASQINLDLDEALFLDNNLTVQRSSVSLVSENSNAHHSHSVVGLTRMDIGEGQHGWDEDRDNDASTDLSKLLSNDRGKHVVSNDENSNMNYSSRLVYNIQTPDLNEVFLPDDHIGGPSHDIDMDPPSPEFNGPTNFPSTPGLLAEPILMNTEDTPASTLQEISQHTAHEGDKTEVINQEVDCPDALNNDPIHEASTSPKLTNLPQFASSPTSVLAAPKPDAAAPQGSGGVFPSSDSVNDNGHIHDEPNDLKLDGTVPVGSASLSITSDRIVNTESSQSLHGTAPDAPNNNPNTSILNETESDSLAQKDSEYTLESVDALHAGFTSNVANNQTISMEGSVVSGADFGINKNQTSFDQGFIKDANGCQPTNITSLNSDFQLRSCTLESNQTNLTSQGDMRVAESVPGSSFTETPRNLETPMADRELNCPGSSVGLQGKDFRSTITTDNDRGVQGNSKEVLLGSNTSINNPMELSSNFISGSEFSEPERMLFAPSGNDDIANDLGHQTTEKGVTESDGSVDRISNLSGHKRRLIDNTPDLQNSISPKTSGMPRKRRNNDYIIPQDDDLLASILVGRKTPALRVGPTPPLPKPASLKRPRMTPKVGLPKRRKVLIDDTIVLHADAIRQQLINTEDIRRIRKKAPCTRPEIWKIRTSSLEDDIFCESIFTDISDDLNILFSQKYGLARRVHSRTSRFHSTAEASKELELSVLREIDGKIQEPSGTLESIAAQSCQNAAINDEQERLEALLNPDHIETSGKIISTAELDVLGHCEVGVVDHGASNAGNECEVPTGSRTNEDFTNALAAANNDTLIQAEDLSSAKVASLMVENMGVDVVIPANSDNACVIDNGASSLDRFVVEVGADFLADVGEVGEPVISKSHAMEESEAGYETVVDEEKPVSEDPNIEQPPMDSVSFPPSTESERVPSAVGENSCMNLDGGLDVESTPMEFVATRETSDFCSAINDIDTDFLNVDDEIEFDDETNNDAPSTEEAQSLENSGWSSRTRGVARYLKILFDEESGRGRKAVAIDNLLAGKTRKEASRMFFETLVLKTKDYIHVEQADPFDYIGVKPRMKLLKSEF